MEWVNIFDAEIALFAHRVLQSAGAFAMAIFLCGRKRFAWLSFFIPVLMGFSRIYFGVHYASDVAAGLAVGLLAGLAAWAAVMLLKRTKWFSRFLGARGITECFGKNRSHDEG